MRLYNYPIAVSPKAAWLKSKATEFSFTTLSAVVKGQSLKVAS
jgi:hypothetical protein